MGVGDDSILGKPIMKAIFFILYLASLVSSECPRGGPDSIICSGVGLCDVYSRCQCSDGFEGPACELRTCPSGEAWSSPYGVRGPYAYEFRSGVHEDAVCSARGNCDGRTGHCICQYGFEGAACERMSCPQGKTSGESSTIGHHATCSGHGLCTNLERLASEFNFWDFPRPSYNTPWDKEKVYGCLCDVGYTGYDCSQRECSVGDDPLFRNRGKKSDFKRPSFQAWRDTDTSQFKAQNSRDHGDDRHAAQNSEDHVVSDFNPSDRVYKKGVELIDEPLTNEVQLIYCQAVSGWFTLRLGDRISGHIPADANPRQVEEALLELKVGPVEVTFTNEDARTACGGYGGGYGGGSGGGKGAQRFVDNVISVEFLTLTGRGARMAAFTGESSVPPLEVEESRFLNGAGASVSLAHGAQGSLLGQHSVATNRGSHTCSNRGICGESDGNCICQHGFVSSDGLVDGMQGGFRLRNDGLVSTATFDCGALDQGVYPNLFEDLAAGDAGGVAKYGGACPGSGVFGDAEGFECSGHGYCEGLPTYNCVCEAGWEGYDCSLRQCPKSRAWFDFPRQNNEAHWVFQECAGRGLCNRELGLCNCEPGYRGASCDVLDCPVGRVYHEKSGRRSSGSSSTSAGDGTKAQHTFGEHIPETPTFSELERSLGFGEPLQESGTVTGGSRFTNLRGSSYSTNPLSHKSARNSKMQMNSIGYSLDTNEENHQLWRGSTQEELKEKREAEDFREHQWSLPPPGVYCSGHGVCLSQAEHAARAIDWRAELDISYGDRVEARTRYSASFWDADRISGCLCDDGWMGYDCSLQTCPFGDDPNSWGQAPEEQLLRCAAGGGAFTLKFRRFGSDLNVKTSALSYNATAQEIEKALESLQTIGDVEVDIINSLNDSFCSPRAVNDSLLFFGDLSTTSSTITYSSNSTSSLSNTSSSIKNSVFTNSTIVMNLKLTSSPSQPLLVTLSAYKSNGFNDVIDIDSLESVDEKEVFIFPQNITFQPQQRARAVNDIIISEYFNVTFRTPGTYIIHANTHGSIEENGHFEKWGNNTKSLVRYRVFNSFSHILTPDLSHVLERRNYTLLPGAKSINYTISISEMAKAFKRTGILNGRGFDDDGDDDGSRLLNIRPYELSGASGFSFHPSSFDLSLNQMSYDYFIQAPTTLTSSKYFEIGYEISGNLSTYFTTPSSSLLKNDNDKSSKILLSSQATVNTPSFLPSIYMGGYSPSLIVSLSSLPPAGMNLTITPKCSKKGATFEPEALVFTEDADDGYDIVKSFQIFGVKSGHFNISYELSGAAATYYSVNTEGSLLVTSPSPSSSVSSLWSLTVTDAPLARVKFLTEGGDVPPLIADVTSLSGKKQVTSSTSTSSSVDIKPGAFIDTFEDGAMPFTNNDKFYSVVGTTESVECSDRGTCNRLTGVCECFNGYRSSDGKGGQGTRGDCGYLAPHVEALWEDNKAPNALIAEK